MGLELNYGINQTQRLDLRAVLSFTNFLQIPLTAVDSTLEHILNDPRRANELLSETSKDFSGGVKAINSDFYDGELNKDKIKRLGGAIIDFPLNKIGDLISENKQIEINPDVIYIAKDGYKPEIEFASHLNPNVELSLKQIPIQYKLASNFYKRLLKQKEWVTKQLREAFIGIRDHQREFLNTLDASKLNYYPLKKQASNLGIDESTLWRLVQGKYAEIFAIDGNYEIHSIKHLFTSSDDIVRYDFVKKLNNYFSEEPISEKCLSDEKIGKLTGLVRRTIYKYRIEQEIPDFKEREKIYQENPAKQFSIPYFRN